MKLQEKIQKEKKLEEAVMAENIHFTTLKDKLYQKEG